MPATVAAIEYDPNRTSYIALHPLRRRRQGLHPGARRGSSVGDTVQSGEGADITVGQLPGAGQHPHRHHRAQRGAHARARGPDGPLGRHGDPARGQGGRLRHPAPPLGRDAHGPRGVPRLHRRDRQRRAPEHRARQGRPLAPQGPPPADPRHGDEPRRPPARRRRGLDHGRPPPGDPLGRAHAGLPHAQEEQEVRSLHRPRPSPRQEGWPHDVTLLQEGPVGRGAPHGAHRGA